MRQVVAYKNNKKALNFQAQKVVAVAYRRWSFIRNSNCKALTGKVLLFWIGGRLSEVVAYERWSHLKVRLCLLQWNLDITKCQGTGKMCSL